MLALINDVLIWTAVALGILILIGSIFIYVLQPKKGWFSKNILNWVMIMSLIVAIVLVAKGIVGYILYSNSELPYCLAALFAALAVLAYSIYNAKYRNCDYLEKISG